VKWFKHFSASYDDEKLSKMTDLLGMEGYGFWWRTLEVVAEKMDETDNCSCAFSAKKWGHYFGFSAKKFEKFARIFEEIGLLSVEISENFIKISIPNLLKYKDNWTLKKGRDSVVNSKKVRPIDTEEDININNIKILSSISKEIDTLENPSEKAEQLELIPAYKAKKSDVPDCPQNRILELYREELPQLRQPRILRPNIQASIKARWTEKFREGKFTTTEEGVEFFRRVFRYVGQNAFLTGRKTNFRADLEWLVKAANWDKVTTGKYSGDDAR
jgi:hypothetical protein